MPHNLSVEESRRVLGLSERTDMAEVLEHNTNKAGKPPV